MGHTRGGGYAASAPAPALSRFKVQVRHTLRPFPPFLHLLLSFPPDARKGRDGGRFWLGSFLACVQATWLMLRSSPLSVSSSVSSRRPQPLPPRHLGIISSNNRFVIIHLNTLKREGNLASRLISHHSTNQISSPATPFPLAPHSPGSLACQPRLKVEPHSRPVPHPSRALSGSLERGGRRT